MEVSNMEVSNEVDEILNQAIRDRVFPGAVIWIGWNGKTIKCAGYGQTAYQKYSTYEPVQVTTDTVYDLASLTKVVATTPAIILLAEQRLLSLEDPVSKYIPRFGNNSEKSSVTIRHLLSHASGLPAHSEFYKEYQDKEGIIEAICNQSLLFSPGTQHLYSDLGFIILGEVVRMTASLEFDAYIRKYLFEPLGMKDTMFNPPATYRSKVAPTELVEWRGGLVHAQVHDENAWVMEGVAGHAGLFSTVKDLARFCKMLLGFGNYANRQVLRTNSVIRMLSIQGSDKARAYGLGWWLKAPHLMGVLANSDAYGHTGFTGTSTIICPQYQLATVLLSNRVSPTRYGPEINPYRKKIANVLAKLIAS